MKVNIMSKKNISVTTTATVISKEVAQYVDQYKKCVQKTAESILGLADIVYAADRELSKEEFEKFRKEIGANQTKDSYIKKLICIAKKSARFNAIKNDLPPNYTTLYSMTKLDDDTFKQVVDDNVVHPDMTAVALSKYLGNKPSKNVPEIILSLKNLSDEVIQLAITEIELLCQKFNIVYKSNIATSPTTAIKKLSNLKSTYIEDIEYDSELETI